MLNFIESNIFIHRYNNKLSNQSNNIIDYYSHTNISYNIFHNYEL